MLIRLKILKTWLNIATLVSVFIYGIYVCVLYGDSFSYEPHAGMLYEDVN